MYNEILSKFISGLLSVRIDNIKIKLINIFNKIFVS